MSTPNAKNPCCQCLCVLPALARRSWAFLRARIDHRSIGYHGRPRRCEFAFITAGEQDSTDSTALMLSRAALSRAALLARRVPRRTLSDKVVADMRLDHGAGGLRLEEADAGAAPLPLFRRWFGEAVAHSEIVEANAMALATVDAATLQPSCRVVLLKGYDDAGFVWYTNYTSRKAAELDSRSVFQLVHIDGVGPSSRFEEGAVRRTERALLEAALSYYKDESRNNKKMKQAGHARQPARCGRRSEGCVRQRTRRGAASRDLARVGGPEAWAASLRPRRPNREVCAPCALLCYAVI